MNGNISNQGLRKVADSLWTSKLRYGLQLCTKVRMIENQEKRAEQRAAQKTQNKMMRMLTNYKIMHRVSINAQLKKVSVNQMATQIKLIEGCKYQVEM
jgi:hypothetical protein